MKYFYYTWQASRLGSSAHGSGCSVSSNYFSIHSVLSQVNKEHGFANAMLTFFTEVQREQVVEMYSEDIVAEWERQVSCTIERSTS